MASTRASMSLNPKDSMIHLKVPSMVTLQAVSTIEETLQSNASRTVIEEYDDIESIDSSHQQQETNKLSIGDISHEYLFQRRHLKQSSHHLGSDMSQDEVRAKRYF